MIDGRGLPRIHYEVSKTDKQAMMEVSQWWRKLASASVLGDGEAPLLSGSGHEPPLS